MTLSKRSIYDERQHHHTTDCNEGAIYGSKCECSSMCGKTAKGVGRRMQDTHVCDRPKKHEGAHRCSCGDTWSDSSKRRVKKRREETPDQEARAIVEHLIDSFFEGGQPADNCAAANHPSRDSCRKCNAVKAALKKIAAQMRSRS